MIHFHPHPGDVLMCDFGAGGFKPPEMVKTRPVVVVSKRSDNLAIVVPLSSTEPAHIESWHWEMDPQSLPESLRDERCWAKCDIVATVGLWRLDRVKAGKCPRTGKRLYVSHKATKVDLEEIRKGLRAILQL